MMGLSTARTAAALEPRNARISAASLLRSRLTAALPGLISSLPFRDFARIGGPFVERQRRAGRKLDSYAARRLEALASSSSARLHLRIP